MEKSNTNTSILPTKESTKSQLLEQVSTLINLELAKIDIKEIIEKLSINLGNNFRDKEISNINSYISEIKISTIKKVKKYLQHNIDSFFYTSNNENNISIDSNTHSKFKQILKEVKNLINNSKVKYKKLYDTLSNDYDKILSQMSEYLQKENIKLVTERMNRMEKIKNDILFDLTSLENIQNKFNDAIKTIINQNFLEGLASPNNKKVIFSKIKKNNSKLKIVKEKRNNSTHSENESFHNRLNNTYSNIDFQNNTSVNNIDLNENECIKLYRVKIKDKKNEIEKLKQQLQVEKESKNKAINELNKLKYSNKISSSILKTQKDSNNLEKINKLTETVINFTYAMNNLRNNLFQKTVSHTDAKNIYGKLKLKLISLVKETYTLKKSIINNNDGKINEEENNLEEKNIEINKGYDYDPDEEDIYTNHTIKEENESSQMTTERNFNKIDENNINEDIDNHNNIENSIHSSSKQGNIVNNISINTLHNYNYESLLEENKKLRDQLAEKIINESEKQTSYKSNNKNFEIYQKQIIELKKIILNKEQEIENFKNNYINIQKEELNNIVQNNTKNLQQLKSIYQLLIDNKDDQIKELEEEILSHDKETRELKEEINKLKTECKKDKILSEAEVNKIKNQKLELECLLEQGGNGNNFLNLTSTMNNEYDREIIYKLKNEIVNKNKQLLSLIQNHDNDLKGLYSSIEMLKNKISLLEEKENN